MYCAITAISNALLISAVSLFFLIVATANDDHDYPWSDEHEKWINSGSSQHGFSWKTFSPKNGSFSGQYCEVHSCNLQKMRLPTKNGAPPPPRGHLQPMGAQGFPPLAVVEVDAKDITPDDFYKKHVSQAVPVLVKGAAREWPAVQKW